VLAIGSTVRRPYEVGGWEVWAEFHPAYEAGDYDAVIDHARETLEASGYASPLYNLACCEALAGRKEDAIAHLGTRFPREHDVGRGSCRRGCQAGYAERWR
jgi:hypothetical protein